MWIFSFETKLYYLKKKKQLHVSATVSHRQQADYKNVKRINNTATMFFRDLGPHNVLYTVYDVHYFV